VPPRPPAAHEVLRKKIVDRSAVLGFVGIGYVGLPVGLAFAAAGFRVRAYDIDTRRVDATNAQTLPFAHDEPGLSDLLRTVSESGRFVASTDATILSGCDVFFLAVDTPIHPDRQLDRVRFLEGIARICNYVKTNTMVIVESTVPPGTIDEMVIPAITDRTGLRAGLDFLVLHCPERLRPGRLLHNLRTLGRLVGGDSDETRSLGTLLYGAIVPASLTGVDYRTAEVVKTAENAARDVQIALANQLAIVCDVVGVDFTAVRDAVNGIWKNEPLVLEPGAGVGGHCLPKDPWLLVSQLPDDASRALVVGARALNDHMPHHVVLVAVSMLNEVSISPHEATIAILGVSYKADSDDTRNSPALTIATLLEGRGATVRLHDPEVPGYDGELAETLRDADLAILTNAHDAYSMQTIQTLQSVMRNAGLLDTRRALDREEAHRAGYRYRAIGVGALVE
jgi:UDP-N-acetyl-D-mannosaminuronic acid dehydrogenase